MAKHPSQPMVTNKDGILRFKKNEIVCFLLATGNTDMNQLAQLPFDDDDRAQFAQLIGYSVAGWRDLSYVTDKEI